MSTQWYLISSPYYTEGDETNEFNFDSELGFNDMLSDTPLGSTITLCKGDYDIDTNTFETETEIKGIVQNNSVDTVIKEWERQLLVPIGTLLDYKYVRYQDSLWLIMGKPTNNKMYEKVVLYMSNYMAKWQNDEKKIIYKPFFVQNASQYNSGENANKTLTVGYNQLLVYCALDDDTVIFNRNKRLFIDYNTVKPTAYEATRVDTVSYSFADNRSMNIIFTETQRNDKTDNVELMLCDYYEPDTDVTDFEIKYVGKPQIRAGGATKTFSVSVDNTATWNINLLPSQTDYVIMTCSNNQCSIKCLNNINLIGSSFKLTATINDVSVDLIVAIVGGV